MEVFIGFILGVVGSVGLFYWDKRRSAIRLYKIVKKYYANRINFTSPCTTQINDIASYIFEIEKLYDLDISALRELRGVYINYDSSKINVNTELCKINWKY